jgi:hypothetical protein
VFARARPRARRRSPRRARPGVEARHVHPVEPVGTLAGEGRLVERSVLAIGLERAELPPDGLGAQIAHEQGSTDPL